MIPDYFEALTGYRVWSCFPNGLLMGVTHSMAWPPMEPHVAQCSEVEQSHLLNGRYLPAPVYECSCGVYVLKQEDKAVHASPTCDCYACKSQWFGSVWGTCYIWGKVIEHRLGYRAQYAYPKELWSYSSERAKLVEQLYGVPCHLEKMPERKEGYEELGDLATYPPSVSPIFLGVITAAYKFWRNQQTPNLVPLPSRYTADPTPQALIKPTFNQVRAVGASRWQKLSAGRRGGKGLAMVSFDEMAPVDWRQVLRGMVYVSRDVERTVDGLTVTVNGNE